MTKKERVRRLAEAGLIAAMYAALTVAVTPIAYGPVQFRISEVLTILPVFTPAAIPGLTVGCFVANLFGLMSGANPAGAWDLLLGPLATHLAALAAYGLRNIRLKGIPVWSAVPAVLTNAVIVGAELAVVYFNFTWTVYGLCALEVGAGQLATALAGGLLLCGILEKSGAARRVFGNRAAVR